MTKEARECGKTHSRVLACSKSHIWGLGVTVYFIEIGDRIKIGFTDDLTTRLKAYPPHSTLLGTREGGRVTEAHEHNQWRTHRAESREWFYAAEELRNYIAEMDNPPPVESRLEEGAPVPVRDDIGTYMRTIRERQNKSQHELAFDAGCSRESIVRFEGGNANITFSNLMSIINALGYDLQLIKRGVDRG